MNHRQGNTRCSRREVSGLPDAKCPAYRAYTGQVGGNRRWVEAIERFSPWLTISGHDHLTPIRHGHWHCRIGDTVCVNVGQSDAGPLHFCLVEAKWAGPAASLPQNVRVTAFPMEESIILTNRPGALTSGLNLGTYGAFRGNQRD